MRVEHLNNATTSIEVSQGWGMEDTDIFTVYINQCTVHSAQCTVQSVQCTLHSAVHSVQCTEYTLQTRIAYLAELVGSYNEDIM